MIPYVSNTIETYEVDAQRLIIKVNGSEESDSDKMSDLRKKLDLLVETLHKNEETPLDIQSEVLEDFTDKIPLNQTSIFSDLLKTGAAIPVSDGAYGYSGLLLEIIHYFKHKVQQFAQEQFPSVTPIKFPVLQSFENYQKSGYFESFPHHIMFQTTLKNDFEVMDAFSRSGCDCQRIMGSVREPGAVIKHAACSPLYPALQGRTLNEDEGAQVFYVDSQCFRNESKKVFELVRLNEFFMSELVFVGTESQVKDCLDKAKSLWRHWQAVFQLNGRIETANDSFFASNYKKLKMFQLLGSSKLEFKLNIPSLEDYIACSSINIHRTYFSQKFQIRVSRGFAHTACFAFGIERLAYALLSQFGLDRDQWPAEVRQELALGRVKEVV